ncbi:hypothetical protein AZI85_14570 [Bdellovibrio bacteriovorus]|uniref:Uncharacterized protein n=1 Tax=Bdellovibrio bacteriovorus TaxID=959 RepID=A0A150WVP4_BDEBC|nr:hypothetical protein [Bdellovibrio bacteriovorus]KYG70352.1 hypothetical protein AZI85_14570 [Bdellovibrio bacteriovorus]
MKFLTLLSIVCLSSASYAFDNPSMLEKYYRGDFNFDGSKIRGNSSNTSFNNSEKWVKSKEGDNQYSMKWDTENVEGSEVLTVSETLVTNSKEKGKSSLYARTSSFYKDKLRASTICYGYSAEGSWANPSKNELKCVTATRRACDRLMDSYFKEAGKNNMISTKAGGLKETQKKAEECSSFLDSYAKMAVAFGNQSSQLEKRQKEVIDQDADRLKAQIKEATGNKLWNITDLNSANSASALDKTAQNFSSSMEGIRALNAALETCASALADFGSPSAQNGSAAAGNSAAGQR